MKKANTLFKAFAIIFLIPMFGLSQEDTLVDSLLHEYKTAQSDTGRIRIGLNVSSVLERIKPLEAINILKEVDTLLKTVERKGFDNDSLLYEWQISYYHTASTVYGHLGDNDLSIGLMIKELKLAQEKGDLSQERSVLGNIGVAYQNQGYMDEAIAYYRKSEQISRKQGNTYGIALALGNIGTAIASKHPDSTLWYDKASLVEMRKPDMRDQAAAMGWMMNNIGSWYKDQGNFDSAFYYYSKSLQIRDSIDHRLGLLIIHKDIAELYHQLGNTHEALNHINQSISIANQNGFKYAVDDSYEFRSELYAELGLYKNAYTDHLRYMNLRDTLVNEENSRELVQQTTRFEYERKHLADSLAFEKELAVQSLDYLLNESKLRQTRNIYLLAGVLILILALGLWSRLKYINKSRALIQKEKDRSDSLLLNILPAEIAEELKEKGRADARDFELVSIIFTDFKEFTQASEKLTAQELVGEINTCFKAFDAICEKYDVEKIKTIGDSYMAAGGLPVPTDDSVKNTVLTGLEMADFMTRRKEEREAKGQIPFEMRVGIHTGPVVAGIVGVKKFQYDIWGDTVNTASRMESHGLEGKVNISQSTYELIRDDPQFQFESRGKVQAKGKGEVEMWFVLVNSELVNSE